MTTASSPADLPTAPASRRLHPSIEPLFERLGNLCTLPAIAQQVIQVADDESADSEDLLAVIEQDPIVAARVMRVVNSSYCGLRAPVGDLKSAITMLGSDRVRTIALTVSIGGLFNRSSPVGEIDAARLWDHSICVATVARLVAQRGNACSPDEAYLAGLLHDLGLLFISQELDTLVPRVLARVRTGVALPEAEREVMAFDHAQLGAYVAWRTSLPERIVAAIDYHHDPIDCPPIGVELTRVVTVANYLATRYGRGSIEGRRLPAPSEGVLRRLDLDLPALRELWLELPESMANVDDLAGA